MFGVKQMSWASGQKLYGERYIIQKKLGEGGIGVTYLAKDKKGNWVVIKTLKDEILFSANVDWYREKFLEEAVQLFKCRHKHIVQIDDFFKDGDLPCLVMEYVEGENLEQRVSRQGILSETEALLYIRQIAEALSVVHDKGLLHRDIKPSNIMVRSVKSEAILIDFGLARGYIPDFTQKITVGLTHGFSPPEQYLEEGRWGEYTDVYALAATLYYLLTNNFPIAAPIRALNAPFKQPKEINSKISNKVNDAIWLGMALDAKKRPQTVQDWLSLMGFPTYRPIQTPKLVNYAPVPLSIEKILQSENGDTATLFCPNEYCQAANPLTHKYCQRCSTKLPNNFLWTLTDDTSLGSPGTILDDRYLVIGLSILLDLKPGLLPQIPQIHNSKEIKAYLKLFPYRLHIPQIYGVIPLFTGKSQTEILLLEKAPLLFEWNNSVHLCGSLVFAWRDASSMRQLNWLWQIANLWKPLLSEGVASSVLEPNLLRVEGLLVRLLELRFDYPKKPTLSQLGEFWQQLVKDTKPAIAEFLKQISDALIEGEINSSEQLIAVLDQGIRELTIVSTGRNAPSQSTTIKIITQTDTGPSRQRNEDACYPPSGIVVSKPPQQTAFAIVCDGIGGHEGGNIASNLAIETIHQQITQLTSVPYENIDPLLLLNDLEQVVSFANDKISQRNDTEHRQGRQRMGTTLVMALPIAHEMYITHVGNSRAYLITRQGCYQVTVDDDVASRDVALGDSLYRQALQASGSDSLLQIIGMSNSASLHPTSQRFIIDEDAVFLLTTDGLSDFDRVEEYWETEILPILDGDTNIENVAPRLIEMANTKNGHDNSTIALVHYQVKYYEPKISLKADIPSTQRIKTSNSTLKTVDLSPKQQAYKSPSLPNWWPFKS